MARSRDSKGRFAGSGSVAGRFARRFGTTKAFANSVVKGHSVAGGGRRIAKATSQRSENNRIKQIEGARANAVARFGHAGANARQKQANLARSFRIGRTSAFAKSLTPNLRPPRRAYGTSASKAAGRR